MYCVKKVLNNNSVLAVDFDKKEEVIFVGNGVGFGKKVNQPFEADERIKKYHLQKETEKGPSAKLINSVDPVYLEIANDILELSEEAFGDALIDNNILLPLADHIAFAVVRMKNNVQFTNPFGDDIRLLYEEEYKVAVEAKKCIEKRTGLFIPDDELSYITLYIHSALSETGVSQSLKIPVIIRQAISRIEGECGEIDMGSFEYNRLLYHIKCMLARVNKNEKLDSDVIAFTKEKCSDSFEIAKEICDKLSEELKTVFTEAEVSYLSLHIERICNSR